MYDTGTIFGGDIVARDHTIGTRSGIYPGEERFVFKPDKVRTFVACNNLCVLEIRGQAGLCEDDMFAALQLDLHIVDLRSYAERSIARQGPWGRGPSDDISTVFEMELCGTSQVFDIAVTAGLVELVRRESRSGSRRIRLDSIALVQVAFFIEFLQQIPKCLDILVIVGDIRVIQVHPITHLLGEVRPLLGIFHHLTATSGVVLIHTNFLTDILFGNTQHFLYAQLYRKTMGVPPGLTAYLVPLHRLEAAERIFDCTGHHMVDTRHPVRRRRSFKKQKRGVPFACRHTLFKQMFLFPLRQHLTTQRSQIQSFVLVKFLHILLLFFCKP